MASLIFPRVGYRADSRWLCEAYQLDAMASNPRRPVVNSRLSQRLADHRVDSDVDKLWLIDRDQRSDLIS